MEFTVTPAKVSPAVFPRFPDGTWAACFKCHARCHNLTFRLVRSLGALVPILPENQTNVALKNTASPPKCPNQEGEALTEHHRGDYRGHLSSCLPNSFGDVDSSLRTCAQGLKFRQAK